VSGVDEAHGDRGRVRIRPVGDDEHLGLARAVSRHFLEDEADEALRTWVPMLEGARAHVADDGGRIVGNWAALPVDVSVPGGARLPCAGVTVVGVSQTHRRRGLLRRLMRTGLDEAVEHGDAVAALYASESALYPRFGFGVAAPNLSYRITSEHLRMLEPVDPTLVVDLDPDVATGEAAATYEVVRQDRGGGVGRTPAQWEGALVSDPPAVRDGASAKRRVHVPGRGYATYRVRARWHDALPDGDVVVGELLASDPEAEQALWQHLLAVDLTRTVTASCRPPDDAIAWMVHDRLRLRATDGPPLYVRLLDVARCLASRTAGVRDGLVLAVHDPDRDQSGTYRWDVSPEGAACSRTDAEPDLTLPIDVLAACWLGGTRPSQLRAARRLEEHRPGAVERLDRMTAVSRAPWTPWEF
jgi:predicted acetyltransferase